MLKKSYDFEASSTATMLRKEFHCQFTGTLSVTEADEAGKYLAVMMVTPNPKNPSFCREINLSDLTLFFHGNDKVVVDAQIKAGTFPRTKVTVSGDVVRVDDDCMHIKACASGCTTNIKLHHKM